MDDRIKNLQGVNHVNPVEIRALGNFINHHQRTDYIKRTLFKMKYLIVYQNIRRTGHAEEQTCLVFVFGDEVIEV